MNDTTDAATGYWVRVPTGHDRVGVLNLVNDHDTITQRAIRRQGIVGYQPATTAGILAALEIARRPLVFFDVGANAGLYSVLCKRLWPDARVVAFEPFGHTADAAAQIASANALDITVERIAVSDDIGVAQLFLSRRSDASHSLHNWDRPTGVVEVDTITVDAYVSTTGIAPTVMKVDVEWHEPAVVRGARQLLETQRPILVVEALPDDEGMGQPGQDALRMLTELGYTAHHLIPPPQVTLEANDGLWRDWLLWPGDLDPRFDAAYLGWCLAVARCQRVRAKPDAQRALLAEFGTPPGPV